MTLTHIFSAKHDRSNTKLDDFVKMSHINFTHLDYTVVKILPRGFFSSIKYTFKSLTGSEKANNGILYSSEKHNIE